MILVFTAATAAWPSLDRISNPGFHGLTRILYEYTSAFANNGSGFEGLGDDTVWWNLTCTVALIVGRFIPILVPLAVAARLAGKRIAPRTSATLIVETPTFAVLTFGVIVMFALLSFFPVLALGPFAEALTLTR